MNTSAPSPSKVTVKVADFASQGVEVSVVSVQLSFGIIDRFSEGLYSSPNKAFEELVTNSFDAGAQNVWVHLDDDLSEENAAMIVLDDGYAMDLEELQSLWLIGESKKRTSNPPPGRPNPVGKFGIGKLAAYVLANEMTFITHKNGRYFALTMDFSLLDPSNKQLLASQNLSLTVVELTKQGAFSSLLEAANTQNRLPKFNQDEIEPDHWTAVILTKLKSTGREIKRGRLRWILRTALPLTSDFNIFYDGSKLQSSKVDRNSLWSFIVGKDEDQLSNLKLATEKGETRDLVGVWESAITLPTVGVIAGTATLFRDSLKDTKSDEIFRSHGFFVRCRGRLINTDVGDADFGLDPELHYGTFSKFAMEVEVPELDSLVSSARESVKESAALDELRQYLLVVFNKARSVLQTADLEDTMNQIWADGRLADPPKALSQGPLRRLIRRAAKDPELAEILGMNEQDLATIQQDLDDIGNEVVQRIDIRSMSQDKPMAVYDFASRSVVLNQDHPFVSNYSDRTKALEPIKLLALADMMAESFMVDEEIPTSIMRRIVRRRDDFLRALVKVKPRSNRIVAQLLRDSSNDRDHLEDAVALAFEAIGFTVKKLGGTDHGPDGIGVAKLGRSAGSAQSDSYAFTYDSKATGKSFPEVFDLDGIQVTSQGKSSTSRISATTARTSVLRVHRERAGNSLSQAIPPSFTIIIAPDYQGSEDEQALIPSICKNDAIVPIKVEDLARLVEIQPYTGLNLRDFRELSDLHSPAEVSRWVEDHRHPKPQGINLMREIITVLDERSETRAPITVGSLRSFLAAKGDQYDREEIEIEGVVRALNSLAPNSFYFDETVVGLNVSSTSLLAEISSTLSQDDDPVLASLVSEGLGLSDVNAT